MDLRTVSFFQGSRQALIRLVLGSIACAATAGFAPAQSAETVLKPVARGDLCVTNGAVAMLPSGRMRIDTASSRAVVLASGGRGAEIRFRYLGPSTEAKPLASGELRRQIGLKLRAQDTCNLVYAMWHIEPDAKLGVSVKRNPGKQTHEECHADGYVTVRPSISAPLPKLAIGEWHDLRADLRVTELTLFAATRIARQKHFKPLRQKTFENIHARDIHTILDNLKDTPSEAEHTFRAARTFSILRSNGGSSKKTRVQELTSPPKASHANVCYLTPSQP